ncbi:MAG: 23S rRNA (pseudouridine(1915)-N(3))-methyltransferase RlmH [Candidatus Eremiobacteraeota bacterium]|nr:23S rRNA (pseudouridine(1915)-N(3))-methyltransferase RlmH [Candidatus Eremiobacteraeota bacterium]
MQVRLIAVDRIRTHYVADACAEMRKRLAPYYAYDEIEVAPGRGADPRAAMREERARILKHVHADDRMWLLERTGMQLSSLDVASRIEEIAHSGARRWVLVVAGTFGADPALRERAEFAWSLSNLTFLHEWARAIVLEQLYRAAKIARNEAYHH